MHELSINRLIAASPEVVWDVMVNRQEEWWCPKPWRAIITAQDKRPGGICDMVMHGPEGEVMQHRGIYLAYDEGKRFAVTDAVTGDLEPTGPFMIGIWNIEPEGSGTRYTASARHWSEEAMRQHQDMGFVQGWTACADQLAALCEAAS